MSPASATGTTKTIDREEVKREQPRGLAEIGLADVLDHCDTELARQAEDRERGEQRHRPPLGPAEIEIENMSKRRVVPSLLDPSKPADQAQLAVERAMSRFEIGYPR